MKVCFVKNYDKVPMFRLLNLSLNIYLIINIYLVYGDIKYLYLMFFEYFYKIIKNIKFLQPKTVTRSEEVQKFSFS